MKIFRSALVLTLLGVYSYVAYLAFNPKVSDAYRTYYITQESDLSPAEIQWRAQGKVDKPKAADRQNN